MKALIFISILLSIISCNQKKKLSDKEKHDLVKNGMSMKEVMEIYGLKDTINRSIKMGECGYIIDSITGKSLIGPNGLTPMVILNVDSNYQFIFSYGKVTWKSSFDDLEKSKKDTVLQRALKELK